MTAEDRALVHWVASHDTNHYQPPPPKKFVERRPPIVWTDRAAVLGLTIGALSIIALAVWALRRWLGVPV